MILRCVHVPLFIDFYKTNFSLITFISTQSLFYNFGVTQYRILVVSKFARKFDTIPSFTRFRNVEKLSPYLRTSLKSSSQKGDKSRSKLTEDIVKHDLNFASHESSFKLEVSFIRQ